MSFVSQFGKNYQDKTEYSLRLTNFKANQQKIDLLNSNPNDTAKYGLNALSDLSETEFKSMLGEKNVADIKGTKLTLPEVKASLPVVGAVSTFDWRNTANKVTAVKDQGNCGSCWAFAAVEALESIWAIKKSQTYTLSPQHIVDCATSAYGCYGCNGGSSVNALVFIANNKGINNITTYPYTAAQKACQTKGTKYAPVYQAMYGQYLSDATIMTYVKQQPVVIYVDANNWSPYKSGIFSNCANSYTVNHAVVVVGYYYTGTAATSYWIVRNSWGTTWGMRGYMNLMMGNKCYSQTLMTFPTVA